MAEFTILDHVLSFEQGRFHHALFLIRDQAGQLLYRAVMLKELTYVPIDMRQDTDVMGKQWMAVRGLYNADVDFSYLAFGAFQPTPLGVSQFYGAQAEGHTEHGALREAGRSMAAVEAVLANFPHSRLQDPDLERVQLLMDRIRTLPRILAILGHPDPRKAEKGMGRDGSLGEMDDELASQQGEMLLRGLAKLRSDFVFAVTAAHIARCELSRSLVQIAQVASQVASRQRGAINAAFSIALPLAAALSDSYSGQHSSSNSHGQSTADSVSQGWGQGESRSWGHSTGYGETRGEANTESVSVTDGVAHSKGTGLTVGTADTSSWAHTDGTGVTHGTADTSSWAHTDSQANTASHGTSVANSEGTNWSQAHSEGVSQGTAHTAGQSHSTTDGTSTSWSQGSTTGSSQSQSHSTGSNWSQGQSSGVSGGESSGWSAGASSGHSGGVTESAGWSASQSQGESASTGIAYSHGESAGESAMNSLGSSSSHTDSSSNSVGVGASTGASVSGELSTGAIPGGSIGAGLNAGVSANASHSWGGSDTAGSTSTTGSSTSSGTSDTAGMSASTGTSHGSSTGVSGGVSASSGWNEGQSAGVSGSQSAGWSQGASSSQGGSSGDTVGSSTFQSQSSSVGGGTSHADTNGTFSSDTNSTTHSSAYTSSHGGFSGVTRGENWGTAQTQGSADTTGGAQTNSVAFSRSSADTVGGARTDSRAVSLTDVVTTSHAVSHGQARTLSQAETVSEGWSEGRAVSRSYDTGQSHSDGLAAAQAVAYGGARGYSGGFSGGLVPGVSLGRSWQTEDHTAMRLSEIINGLQSLLNHASAEGGFLTSAMLLVDERGAAAARALVPQAFHGPQMPTPILTVDAGEVLRPHALALRPSLDRTATDPFGIGLWTRYATLHTPEMVAALTAPNLFEEGLATTVQERIPAGLAFYPGSPGEVILAHQVSPETGDLTPVPLRLDRERHFHTAFTGDTGYGKSVAAVRLVLETTHRWHMRSIVLDFGAGWRQLLNAPELAGRVEIRQLSPGGVRPLRWNPLQIGRYVLPEVQWRAFCDIFGAVARLGVRRQVAELREALRQVYLGAGVLVDDPDLPAIWTVVRMGEEAISGAAAGDPLSALDPDARQQLAVRRSQAVGLKELYQAIEDKLKRIPDRDVTLRGVLEGILFRLHPLVQGAAARQYASGSDAIDLNAIVPGDWGVAILEGGAFLDEFSKAFLLGWTAWHIYNDAVVQRIRRARHEPAHIQLVFEEANKILSGINSGGEEEGGAAATAEQFAAMWRDSRKYGIWLHLITQSPSLLPPGILSSCNNLFASQTKHRKDQDVVVGMLHKSPVGYTDEVWRRFLASLPVARAVVKLGYAFDRAMLEPVYVQPQLVQAAEPSDVEIEARLGRIAL